MTKETQSTFAFRIEIAASPPCPEFRHDIGRINVVLGSNGTGKSSLLKAFQQNPGNLLHLTGALRYCSIVGDRVLRTYRHSILTRNEATNSDGMLQGMFSQETLNEQQLQKFAGSLLEMLCQDHMSQFKAHSEACQKLQGPVAEVPKRRHSKLDRFVELFTRVFPDIELRFDPVNVSVECQKYGRGYGIEQMSTGEKQAFLLLGRFFLREGPEIFLVDEPDRNMNPKLAERFWSTIETEHPRSVFVYATHQASFALRPGVDRIFLLDGKKTTRIDDIESFASLPRNDREEFLGSIPSIVTRSKVLLTEGNEEGIEKPFFEFLIEADPSFAVLPLGDCELIARAVSGTDVWNRFTSGVKLAAVVDRDFRSDEQIDNLQKRGLIVLPFHEIESLYCHPDILALLAERRCAPENRPQKVAIVSRITSTAQEVLVRTALKRATARLASNLSVSGVEGSELDRVGNDPDKAEEHLLCKEGDLRAHVAQLDYVSAFREELARIEQAIENSSMDEILRLVEGKLLLNSVLQFFSMPKSKLIAEVHHHLAPGDLPPSVLTLKDKILEALK